MDRNGGTYTGRSRAPGTIDDTRRQDTVRIARQAEPVHEVPPDAEIEAAIVAWQRWEEAVRRTNAPGLSAWRRATGRPDPGA